MESIKFNDDLIEKIGAITNNYKIYNGKFLICEIDVDNNFDLPARIEFGIIICTRGSAELLINFKPIAINNQNTIFNLLPNIIQMKNMSDDFKVKVIFFEEEFAKKIILNLGNPSVERIESNSPHCIYIPRKNHIIFDKYFDLINALMDTEDNKVKSDSFALLFASLGNYVRSILSNQSCTNNENTNRNDLIFQEFISIASISYKKERTVNFYASHFSLTPKYFSQIIKQVSGKSASEWIDELTLFESQSLLCHSALSVQEIAYKLNFESASLYGRYFKSHMGVSPGMYRKMHKK